MLGRELICKEYEKFHNNHSKLTIIPFSEFENNDPPNIFIWHGYEISQVLNLKVFSDLTHKKFIILGEKSMDNCSMTVEIPYKYRDEYIKTTFDLVNIVGHNGNCSLWVKNMIYDLKSYLCIEYSSELHEKIDELISNSSLIKRSDVGPYEFFQVYEYGNYDVTTLMPDLPFDVFSLQFVSLYEFCSENDYKESGRYLDKEPTRKKIFISYCHTNKDIVYAVTEALEKHRANLWIDKKDLLVGEQLLTSILTGIKESDFAVIFLSKATLNSPFGKAELENIMTEMIKKKMNWYVVKVDDVDVNDILPMLGNYKYFDLLEYGIDELIKDLLQRIKTI